jgi:catechol-2,3-dioxygenase
MKRFHIHVGVKNLENSIQFYSTLFGQKPIKQKNDYAKWLLDDPHLNFAISTRSGEERVNHLGIQVEESNELEEITERLKKADLGVYDEGEVTCCYAESNKAWVKDPSGIAWEAYQNMNDAEVYTTEEVSEESEGNCCGPEEEDSSDQNRCC